MPPELVPPLPADVPLAPPLVAGAPALLFVPPVPDARPAAPATPVPPMLLLLEPPLFGSEPTGSVMLPVQATSSWKPNNQWIFSVFALASRVVARSH